MAGVSVEDVAARAGVAVSQVVVCIPLPPVAQLEGITLVTPRHPGVCRLFDLLGGAVALDRPADLSTLMVCTCFMGAFYAQQDAMHAWLVGRGVDSQAASTYLGAIYACMASDSKAVKGQGFGGLVAEQTPGGMNEQVLSELGRAGVYENVKTSMTSIANRLEGKPVDAGLRWTAPVGETAAVAAPEAAGVSRSSLLAGAAVAAAAFAAGLFVGKRK